MTWSIITSKQISWPSFWSNSEQLYFHVCTFVCASQYYKSLMPIHLHILFTSMAKIAGKTGTYCSMVTGHFSTPPFPNDLPNQTYCLFSCWETKTKNPHTYQNSRNWRRGHFTKKYLSGKVKSSVTVVLTLQLLLITAHKNFRTRNLRSAVVGHL